MQFFIVAVEDDSGLLQKSLITNYVNMALHKYAKVCKLNLSYDWFEGTTMPRIAVEELHPTSHSDRLRDSLLQVQQMKITFDRLAKKVEF